MPQANAKIAAGLDRIEGRKPIPLSQFRTLPTNVSGLNQRTADLVGKVDALRKLNSEVVSKVEKTRTEAKAAVDAVGWVDGANGVRTSDISEAERRRLLKRKKTELERAARAHKAEERERLSAEIRDYRGSLDALRSFFSSPVRILNNKTFGSEERSRYFDQLQSAGPATVEMHAYSAVATSDPNLMAAVLQRVDGMTRRERQMLPLSRDQLALSVVAEDFRKAQSYLVVQEIQLLQAEISTAETAGKSATMAKIKIGQKRDKLARLGEGDTEFLESLLGANDDVEEAEGEQS